MTSTHTGRGSKVSFHTYFNLGLYKKILKPITSVQISASYISRTRISVSRGTLYHVTIFKAWIRAYNLRVINITSKLFQCATHADFEPNQNAV